MGTDGMRSRNDFVENQAGQSVQGLIIAAHREGNAMEIFNLS